MMIRTVSPRLLASVAQIVDTLAVGGHGVFAKSRYQPADCSSHASPSESRDSILTIFVPEAAREALTLVLPHPDSAPNVGLKSDLLRLQAS